MFGFFKKEKEKVNNSDIESNDKFINIDKCISDIVDLVAEEIGDINRVIIPEQAISSCANLIGYSMFMSFGFNTDKLEPGSILLSEQANEMGPRVIGRLESEISQYGLKIDQTKVKYGKNEKNLTYIETLKKIQKRFIELINKYNYSYEEAMIIAISATAFIINNVSSKIDVSEGFGISIFGIIEGSKTVPLSIK